MLQTSRCRARANKTIFRYYFRQGDLEADIFCLCHAYTKHGKIYVSYFQRVPIGLVVRQEV